MALTRAEAGPWDPPAPPDEPDAPGEASAGFPCGACGAHLGYKPGTEALECPFCGHSNPVSSAGDETARARAIVEQDYHATLAGLADGAPMEVTQVVRCESCGAQVELGATVHADKCPFCASPVVTETAANRHIKPQALLPFGIDRNDARTALKAWIDGLWFAPNGLKKYATQGRDAEGVYIPFWTFDAQTQTEYRGRRGTTRTRTVRGADGKTTTQTYIVWRNVSGRVARFFDDVLVLGSETLPRKYVERLDPWDFEALQPYDHDYIAGFRAEAYTVALPDAYVDGRGIMDEQIRSDIRRDIGGDHQRITAKQTRIWDETFKHILLPVWVVAYRYGNRSFQVVVNGRTGEVQGERPYSAWKIAFAVIAGAIVAGAIAYGYHVYQGG